MCGNELTATATVGIPPRVTGTPEVVPGQKSASRTSSRDFL
jgi:hypothetical protein